MPTLAKDSIDKMIYAALADSIAAHPCADTIRSILNGEKYKSGVMPMCPELHGRGSFAPNEPVCVSDLNNFHAHLHGGNYRAGELFRLSKSQKGRTHLSLLMEDQIRNIESDSVDLIKCLGGFSLRYLSQTSEELWKQVDANTEEATSYTPKEFGELFRSFQSEISKLGMQITLASDENYTKLFTEQTGKTLPEVDLNLLSSELENLRKYWQKKIEPKTLALFQSLIADGYSLRDFWA